MATTVMNNEQLRKMVEESRLSSALKMQKSVSAGVFSGTVAASPYPPELQKKLDDLDAEAKRLRQQFKEDSEENERQRLLAKYNLKIGDTLYGEDGETAQIVWVQSREQGGNLVLNITRSTTIRVAELEHGYWRQTEERPKEPEGGYLTVSNGGTDSKWGDVVATRLQDYAKAWGINQDTLLK